MKAIILVGGEGTRLRPLTYLTVKAMVPVLNKPFIQHTINYLKSHDINEIILAMGYKPDSIKNYFGESGNTDTTLKYSIEQFPLGTAGAVKNAENLIDNDDAFFVFNGDIFTNLDLTDMLHFHKKNSAKVTIALTPIDDPSQFGVVEINEKKQVTQFVEKPKKQNATTNLINAGTYILEPEILKYIPKDNHFMFEHNVFPQLIADDQPVYGYYSSAYWIDMGNPEKYMQLNQDLLMGKCDLIKFQPEDVCIDQQSSIHPQAVLEGPILIDKGCIIEANVKLQGPLIIGSNCIIRDSAFIKSSILWQNIQIGEKAIIKDSIITSENHIENNECIENSVVGNNATVNRVPLCNQKANIGG